LGLKTEIAIKVENGEVGISEKNMEIFLYGIMNKLQFRQKSNYDMFI